MSNAIAFVQARAARLLVCANGTWAFWKWQAVDRQIDGSVIGRALFQRGLRDLASGVLGSDFGIPFGFPTLADPVLMVLLLSLLFCLGCPVRGSLLRFFLVFLDRQSGGTESLKKR